MRHGATHSPRAAVRFLRPTLPLVFLCLAGAAIVSPALAAPKDVSACHAGQDPQLPGSDWAGGFHGGNHGLTPVKLAGATTVSVAESRCLMDRLGNDLLILSAFYSREQIPGFIDALPLSDGYDKAADNEKARLFLEAVTEGNKERPLLFYCAGEECFMSYNAALRAVRFGYRQVYWFRPGVIGWKQAGLPLDYSVFYQDSLDVTGLSEALDYSLSRNAAQVLSEVLRKTGGTELSEPDLAKAGPIAEEEYARVKALILRDFATRESKAFSYEEIKRLDDFPKKWEIRAYYEALNNAAPPDEAINEQALKAIINAYVGNKTNYAEVYYMDSPSMGAELVNILFKRDGTSNLIAQQVTQHIMPQILEEVYKVIDPKSLNAADKQRLDSVIAEIEDRLIKKHIIAKAESVAAKVPTEDIKALVFTPLPEEAEKVRKMRLSAESEERYRWAQSEIQKTGLRVYERILAALEK